MFSRSLKIAFLLSLLTSAAGAQSTVSVTVQWDPNPPADAVSTYTVTWLTQAGGNYTSSTVPAGTACTTTVCSALFPSIPVGNWNLQLYATNSWGNSPPTIVSVNMAVPSTPTGLRVVKQTTPSGTTSAPSSPSAPVAPPQTIAPSTGKPTITVKPTPNKK